MSSLSESITPMRLAEELVGPVADALITTAWIGSIESFGDDKPVEDQTFKFLVRSSGGAPVAVVLCSPVVSPDLIARGMLKAVEAKSALGPELGRAVLTPIAEGEVRKLSYAVLPYGEPLAENWLKWWLQRRRLRPAVLNWLRGLTRQTMRDVSEADKHARFIRPLRHLSQLTGASAAVRSAAKQGLERLEQDRWKPRFVLMHNDLWKGNFLLDGQGGFVIIDWPGAMFDGYAVYDLARLAGSFGLSAKALGGQLQAHCRVLGCEPRDALSHLAAGLGHLSQNLEHFPMRLFLPLADQCVRRASSAVSQAR